MFTLAASWVLSLLILPWIVRKWLKPAQVQTNTGLIVPFFAQLQQVDAAAANASTNLPRLSSLLLYGIWFCLVFAASGPQWLGVPHDIERSGRNIMLALDLSGSMQLQDMQLNGRNVDRLTIVKKTAEAFIQRRNNDRLGLVLFGSRAYLQTPLTFDQKTMLYMLDDATIGLAGERTAIGDAIGIAVKRLQTTPEKGRVIILLTDGANNDGVLDPIQAGEIAAANNVKIYTIGIGANQMRVRGIFGDTIINPSEDLDEDALRQIAEMTGGVFFRALETTDLERVYRTIDALEPVSRSLQSARPITPYYHWPLLVALIGSFYVILRRYVWPQLRMKNHV